MPLARSILALLLFAGVASAAVPVRAPRITQYDGHPEQHSNCGPATLAMVARHFGRAASLHDEQLIDMLARIAKPRGAGTPLPGIHAMAHALELRADTRASFDERAVAAHLHAGGTAIVAGNFNALPFQHKEARPLNHYIAIVGMDDASRFLVRDPADPPGAHAHAMSGAELRAFTDSWVGPTPAYPTGYTTLVW